MWRSVMKVAAIAISVAVIAQAASVARAEVLPDEMKKIEAACPKTAPAKPAKPRKILVFSHCNGYNHRVAIERAKIVLPMMGEKTGAYTTVVSDDLSNFEPDKLKEFDLVVLNNTTGELLQPAGPPKPRKPRKPNPAKIKDAAKLAAAQAKYEKALVKYEKALVKYEAARKVYAASKKPDKAMLRASFMSWVKGGGGVFAIHAATDCSYRWKEYGDLIGGYFWGHPWNRLVPVRNDDPTNPINAVFGGKGFEIADEIYMFRMDEFYSREKQRVILSLETAGGRIKSRRTDNDYAVSWIKSYGKGRMFYCSLGHRGEIFSNAAVLAHYLAGMQWAMGDLKGVDATPKPLETK